MTDTPWDVFICHASEDKDSLVQPLARALSLLGLQVWYDEFSLTVGDSLSRSIDRGIAGSRPVRVGVRGMGHFRGDRQCDDGDAAHRRLVSLRSRIPGPGGPAFAA
jgi:hypothetical protein